MDHVAAAKKNKGDQIAPPRPSSVTAEAAVMKKKPTTLLDAFEVECIRRELEKLVAKQSNNRTGAVGKGGGATAVPGNDAHGHQHRHHGIGSKTTVTTTTTSARRKVEVSPSTAPGRGGGVRLLGRHAVTICSGAAPVSGGHVIAGGIRRRGGYREVEKV
jgi:hypothetical protein